MSQLDAALLWGVIVYYFLVQAFVIELVREERYSSLQLQNGKVETFSASVGAGFSLWFVALLTMSCTLGTLEASGNNVLLALLMIGSLIVSISFTEIVTQLIVRRLFTDIQCAGFFEILKIGG